MNASFNSKTDNRHWFIFIATCHERGVDPWVLLDPLKHKSQTETRDRKKIIVALHNKGLRTCEIEKLVPVSRRTIERSSSN